MIVALAHAFVASRIDHCCSVLVGLPLGVLERLDWGLRSAARLIERVSKMLSLSLHTCVMCRIGCLCPSGYYPALLL